MAYTDWNPDYDLGIAEIDRQHRRLVEIVNRLHDAVEQECPKGPMQAVVCDLMTYMEIHFAYEENLMQCLRFPALESHHREHSALTREVEGFEAALARGRAFVSTELTGVLKKWMLDHLLHVDRVFADHAHGMREAGALASRQ